MPRYVKSSEGHPKIIINSVAVTIYTRWNAKVGLMWCTVHRDPGDTSICYCTVCMRPCILGTVVAIKSLIVVLTAKSVRITLNSMHQWVANLIRSLRFLLHKQIVLAESNQVGERGASCLGTANVVGG